MDILKNEPVMTVLRDAAEKLKEMGLTCYIFPNDLPHHGMTVSLHVAESEIAADAAIVSNNYGAEQARANPDQFASDVADYLSKGL